MAYSISITTGNGLQEQFVIPFDYVSVEHVKCYLDGVETAYTLTDPGMLELATAPASGVAVKIQRITPSDESFVNFVDGSVLDEDVLDLMNRQLLFLSQETIDAAGVANNISEDALVNALDALGISSATTTLANAAVATAGAAEAKADTAVATAAAAEAKADTAVATANAATVVAEGIEAKADTALANSVAANSTAEDALFVATAAASGAVASFNSRVGLVVSEAGDYTSVQVTHGGGSVSDELSALNAGKAATSHTHAISDVTALQTALDGKAGTAHTHAISDVTALQTALDGKSDTTHTHAYLPLAGGTMTGGLITTQVASKSAQEKVQSAATTTVEVSDGAYITRTVTGAATWASTTSTLVGGYATSWVLELTNGGLGAQTFTGVKWSGGTAPTLTAAGVDILVFTKTGTTVRGYLAAGDSK